MEAKSRREGRRRLHVDLPDHLFDDLKQLSVNYRCTMTKIVIRALIEKIKREGSKYEESKGKM